MQARSGYVARDPQLIPSCEEKRLRASHRGCQIAIVRVLASWHRKVHNRPHTHATENHRVHRRELVGNHAPCSADGQRAAVRPVRNLADDGSSAGLVLRPANQDRSPFGPPPLVNCSHERTATRFFRSKRSLRLSTSSFTLCTEM